MTGVNQDDFDFEKGLQRLEEIVALFDQGGLTLDQMETHFIEGMRLIQQCTARLDGVEARITQWLNQSETEWPKAQVRNEE